MPETHEQDGRAFAAFFHDATGLAPYEWQARVAVERIPQVLLVPTRFGKTEGVALAWARRVAARDSRPPASFSLEARLPAHMTRLREGGRC